MRLYLIRHAIAVPPGTPGYTQDALRPLTEEGHAQARQVAEGLKRLDIPLDVILTSPYVRAAQTAEHLSRAFGSRMAVKQSDALRAEADPIETSQALKTVADQEHVACVGHEPHLSAWVAHLVSGRDGMRCLMKKGGVACIELPRVPSPPGGGILRWLMTPKQLGLIGQTT